MTQPITEIDDEMAIAALRRVVAEAGADYVYNPPGPNYSCVYLNRGAPSCGVGHALIDLGVPDVVLSKLDGLGEGDCDSQEDPVPASVPIYHRRVPELIAISEKAIEILSVFQGEQDYGSPWGEALEVAESAFTAYSTS